MGDNERMNKKAYIKTYGCQMNVHDSEKMAGILAKEGYDLTEDEKDADVIVFNTCSIRDKADQKFLSDLGRMKAMKAAKPHTKIAVAGCIAQQMGKSIIKRAPHVDLVLGPQNLHMLGDMLRENTQAVATMENPTLADMELPRIRKEGTRAWVSIMFGCNNFCTYCIVPYTRGREKSRPSANIIKEIQGLASDGYSEITLLGQNVNSYSSDMSFAELLRNLDAIEGIKRLRFVTSHPRDISDELIAAMGELDSVCEHLHLPMQSGSTAVLKGMNRRYSREDYLEKVRKLKELVPNISLSSDIICGFPGETEQDHKDTISAIAEVQYDGLFAFKYSPRPGTKAEDLGDQVPEEVKLARLHEVLALQDEITHARNKALVGEVFEVLVEGPSNDPSRLQGRTGGNKIVNFEGDNSLIGKYVDVKIIKGQQHSLIGELASG
jgi:tRNA-2-methylthio-N6-dimethylallyladenosine synthase